MITGREDLLGAIAEAWALEKGLKEFYGYAAGEAAEGAVKDLLLRLKDWEDSHMEYLSFLHRSVQGETDLASYREFSEKMSGTHMESGIPVKEGLELYKPQECQSEADVIKVALRIEGKAYNLYRGLSEKAADANARVVFADMKEQEQKHIDLLKEQQAGIK